MTRLEPETVPAPVQRLLETVRDRAEEAGVFGSITLSPGHLACEAKESAELAHYRLRFENDVLWVVLDMKDRWLSESIEAELLHTGDKLEELIDEELVEMGCDKGPLPFEHFRSDDFLFTFRSPVPIDLAQAGASESIETATMCLLAYEAAFRELGDMQGTEDDD